MAKMTISVCKGRGSINHNNREFSTQNVDQDRTPDNIIYKQERLEDAYEKLFGAEVARYNQGKKPCRQIENYMEHIRNSKNGEKLFYENVVQVGDKFSCPVDSREGETAEQILDRYMKNFEKRNPNLYVFNAVLHMDEATPHLHIDYIPVAHGYKNGLQVRNSLDKALKEQGVDGKSTKKENSTHNWQEREKNSLEEVMHEFGWERKAEKGISREHLTVDQYKAVAEQIRNEVKKLPKQIESAPTLTSKERVTVYKKDLAMLEKRAKLSLVHEKATRQLENEIMDATRGFYASATDKQHEAEKLLEQAKKDREKAKLELFDAEKAKYGYTTLLEKQQNLNEEHRAVKEELTAVKEELEELRSTNNSLKQENSLLKLQMSDLKERHEVELKVGIEKAVEQAISPLNDRISRMNNSLKELSNATVTMSKACAWVKKYFKNDKLRELCDAVQDYAEKTLRQNGMKTKSSFVREPELDVELKAFMEPEYKKIVYIDGHKGYGWYSSKEEGHVHLGAKADLSALMTKYPDAKFEDPFDHVPQLHKMDIGLDR